MDSRWSKDWLTGSFGLLHCLMISVESRCCSSPFAPHPQRNIDPHAYEQNGWMQIYMLFGVVSPVIDWLTGAHNRIVLHSALHPSILCPPHSETVGATQANNVVLFPAPGVGLFSGYIGQNILCWAEEEQQQKERKQLTHSPLYRTEIGKWVSQSERERMMTYNRFYRKNRVWIPEMEPTRMVLTPQTNPLGTQGHAE